MSLAFDDELTEQQKRDLEEEWGVVFLCFGVQEQCKGNAGAPGVYYVAVHVGELETQVAQGYGVV